MSIEGAGPAPKTHPASRGSLATVAFEVGGKLVGGRFTELFKEMRRVQWLPAEELQARSNARLSALLKHAAENVPFYQQEYRRLGLAPDDLRNVNDLTRLPTLGKADYRQRRPEEFYATNIPAHRRLEKTTSGSTGEPFQFCLDRAAMTSVFASHLFYDSWYNLGPFDRYVRIAATPPAPPSLPTQTPAAARLRQVINTRLQGLHEWLTQERISVWEVDAERALEIWRRIESFRPKFVMGYTSSLATIADELLRRNLPLSRPVSAVVTIAETLSPTRRRLIEEYFRAPIINRYGLREFGSWSAQSCAESPDRFHINTELVVCEILRADGTPCAPGESGRVVLTDLRNYARPFIRYETGDLAVMSAEKCECGRGFPLLAEIQGRSQESLRTPSGKQISSVVLGHYLFVYHDHLKVVRHYQLVQESGTKATLLVVPDEGWNEEHRSRLQADLARLVGDEMEVAVQTVDEIPKEKSGKRPIIKVS